MNAPCYQRSFTQEPALGDRLFPLLESCFPGINPVIAFAKTLGASWESASTPFIRFENEQAVSHVGVLEIPLWLMGQSTLVAGIHAVCTHPDYRRRGYYRQIMAEVMAYCSDRYSTLVLTTSQPELYEPFGFRKLEEHIFTARCSSSGKNGFRSLDLRSSADRTLLHRLLETRSPVSNIVGVTAERPLFCFNEGSRSLSFFGESNSTLFYAEDLDLLAVMEVDRTTLKIFDIVSPQICSLAEILKRLPHSVDQAEIYFSPDRLQITTEASPHRLEETWLMVHGSFSAEAEAKTFMLPRSARC